MKKTLALIAATTALIPVSAWADTPAAEAPATVPQAKEAFTTGVAKGRDLLDTAISASTLSSSEIRKIGTPSIAEILDNIPGIHAITSGTDGITAVTIRGLPLAADGSKFLQIEEDGLPVLEFGDIHLATATSFMRTDLTLSQVQAIRGGSASTFASNSPGGVVNFISRTGEEDGGMIQVSSGLNYALGRVDFDYGSKIDDHLRFNIGGFYRQGEGPRATGYDAFRGGQLKFNMTRTFDTGYIRVYAKIMDDREPSYGVVPVVVSGTNGNPSYGVLPGFDARNNTPWSRYVPNQMSVDQTNSPRSIDLQQGVRSQVHAVGMEAQFDVAGWNVTDRFRYSEISGVYNENSPFGYLPASAAAAALGGPGATLSYADGPMAGQSVTNPGALNGNGLTTIALGIHNDINSLNNAINDFRATRVFSVGGGKLTTTGGLYASSQDINMTWAFNTTLNGFASGGNSTLFDITTANGTPVTQQGTLSYDIYGIGGAYHRQYDVNFRVLAPYGSVNYQLGKLAIGGSLRYDFGHVGGAVYGGDLGGSRIGVAPVDINGNGMISLPETQTAVLPLSQPGVVSYNYGYLSYSAGVNYRFADSLSAFARYSRGGRASADRNLFPPSLNAQTGQLTDPSLAYSPVKQAEVGAKFRKGDVTVYATGFWASTGDINYQVGADATGKTVVNQIDRTYSAKGVELETEARHGPFSLRVGATYTVAKIDKDLGNPAEVGLTPREEPKFFFTAMPQFENKLLSIGANIMGVSSSFAQDTDVLRQPGYVMVNPFIQIRPAPRVAATINVFNLFNKLALVAVNSAAIPTGGVVGAQVLDGRTVTGSISLSF